MKIVARTLAGLEKELAKEITEIGGIVESIDRRAVVFQGDKEIVYKSNLWSRLAIDILLPISEFSIKDENDLYSKVKQIKWNQFLSANGTFSITPVIHSNLIKNSHFATLKTKDAVVDYFRDKYGSRPNIEKKYPDLKITLRISEKKCTILLNSSGDPLFKRGYRKTTGEAPINEILAAGIIALSSWDEKQPFIDPMCGSGTFLIEAGMKALAIAPGYYRKKFGFEKWPDFDRNLWQNTKAEAQKRIKNIPLSIQGYDQDFNIVRLARKNLNSLPELASKIRIEQADFFNLTPNKRLKSGYLFFNPPYDKRIALTNDTEFYNNIGSSLKHNWQNWQAWIISSNLSAMKHIGLKPSQKFKLYNGGDESLLVNIKMYSGSKKPKN